MDPKDLRVSDAEREHVGALLQRAVGQGMLSLGEFTERMDTALAAKTRGELNAVLVDLPGMTIAGQAETRPSEVPLASPVQDRPASGLPADSRPASGLPADIRATMSTVHRTGSWSAPSTLRITSKMSTVTLDFTTAVLASRVVTVHVDDYFSTLVVVVPDGASVDLDGVDTVGGSVSNKVRSTPVDGALHVVVRGRVRFGSVTAKHSFGTTVKRMFG